MLYFLYSTARQWDSLLLFSLDFAVQYTVSTKSRLFSCFWVVNVNRGISIIHPPVKLFLYFQYLNIKYYIVWKMATTIGKCEIFHGYRLAFLLICEKIFIFYIFIRLIIIFCELSEILEFCQKTKDFSKFLCWRVTMYVIK